jgi:putative inorganic carbon (HCO3(-)) transporter
MLRPGRLSLSNVHAGLQGLLCLLAPLSLECPVGEAFRLSLPGEGLALLLAPIVAVRLLVEGRSAWDIRTVLRSPLFWIGACWLVPLVPATVFSTMPLVSAKYLLAEGLHVWVFGLGAVLLMRDDPKNLEKGVLLAAIGATAAALYVLVRHAGHGFSAEFTTITPRPFFPDDTMYSALLWMALPPIVGLAAVKGKVSWWAWAALLLTAIAAARCRGAWLGGVAVLGVVGLSVLRIGRRGLLAMAVAAVLAGVFLWPVLTERLRERGDVSILERLNRYSCAWRMAADRPLTGFGPGTYQFVYLPYQLPDERTRISVDRAGTAQEGRGGEAHSEYFQRLADAGWPGLLGLLAGLGIFLWTGSGKICFSSPEFFSRKKLLHTALWLAVIGYWVHALTNNFLHADKVAVWVMGAMAAVLEKD